jgi:NADH:ubiquinone reductase (H+-translocating)
MTQTQLTPAHIVIIGCGFGGLEAAKAFKGKSVKVTLIDRTNHHLFQPLLYQVATAGLAAPSISVPIRHLFRDQQNVTTLLGDVRSIDAQAKRLAFVQPDSELRYELSFDHLIVAAGATHSYFGHDAWERHAPGLKTLADAFEIRRKILMAFEAAEAEENSPRREALLTFVVIGAGPTGVEMAGTMAEIARHTLAHEFRRINSASAKVILLEGSERVLQTMPPALSEKALRHLTRLGVEVRLNARVTKIDAEGISVDHAAATPFSEEKTGVSARSTGIVSYQINSKTVVWAAGVAASTLGQALAQSTGCELDRAGRVKVQPDLSLAHAPHISVIGDMASLVRHVDGKQVSVPGVSPAAKQMGQCAAANVMRRLNGQNTSAFHYADYGNLATIGRNAAVVDLATPLGPLRFSGKLAWLFWLFAHIYFLIGFRNRFVVLSDWTSAYLSFSRSARVVAQPQPSKEEVALS